MATRWQVEGHVPLSIGMKMTSVSADGLEPRCGSDLRRLANGILF